MIADERKRAMIAIRDRFGIKPLFYAVEKGEVYFASEIKALLALGVPAVWDSKALPEASSRTRSPSSRASTRCRRALRDREGGDVRSIRTGIGIPTAAQMRPRPRSEAEVVAGFRAVLEMRSRAAGRRRRGGGYLSGGIDSCAVLGLAQRELSADPRVHARLRRCAVRRGQIAAAQAKLVGSSSRPFPSRAIDRRCVRRRLWHAETPC